MPVCHEELVEVRQGQDTLQSRIKIASVSKVLKADFTELSEIIKVIDSSFNCIGIKKACQLAILFHEIFANFGMGNILGLAFFTAKVDSFTNALSKVLSFLACQALITMGTHDLFYRD